MTHVSLKVIPIPGDGDCLYHAIIKGLDVPITSQHLRNFVADQILANPDLYDDLVRELVDFDRIRDPLRITPEKLANVIRHTKEWATSTVIHILAEAFNIRVIVIQKINDQFFSEEFPSVWKEKIKLSNEQHHKKIIYIYRRGYHFELLEPIGYIDGNIPGVTPLTHRLSRKNNTSNSQRGGAYREKNHSIVPLIVGMLMIMISTFTF